MLTAAVEYGIEDLKKLCIDFFKSTLTVDTVCEALQAAISYNNSDLKKTCLGFVERNTLVRFSESILYSNLDCRLSIYDSIQHPFSVDIILP